MYTTFVCKKCTVLPLLQMMRLVKDSSNELGIIISSKKNVANGMTGYSIAHIEPSGLIDRWA